MKEKIFGFFLPFAWLVMIIFGIAQLYVGYLGIDHHLGNGWAIFAVVLALVAQFHLPIIIGSYFGAMNVLGWHWGVSLIFAAPGLFIWIMILLFFLKDLLFKKE